VGNEFEILLVGRDVDQGLFGPVDVEMLVLLSRQAAVALENTRLYLELQDHVQEIQKSQRALIQAEKMAAVGRLTASLAHEINNPLQSVRNCIHLIEYGNLNSEALEKYLKLVNDELDRLTNAAKRMLEFYRPSALERQVEDVNVLIEQALQLLESQLRKNQIKVHLVMADTLPKIIVVSNQIQQVIFNIVLNAMEAMLDGGDLFIETKVVDDQVIIRIEDTGPGIPKTDEVNVFEPFYGNKEDGLGLGLTVSYGIVTAHNGTLELVPSSKSGAHFQISLPVGGKYGC
jgi:two-component system NtrC family sensor kinase